VIVLQYLAQLHQLEFLGADCRFKRLLQFEFLLADYILNAFHARCRSPEVMRQSALA